MANIHINRLIKSRQMRLMGLVGFAIFAIVMTVVGLLAEAKPKKHALIEKSKDLTGIIDESFTEANANSAMTAQQSELDALKVQLGQLTNSMKDMRDAHEKEMLEATLKNEEMARAKSEASSLSPEQRLFTTSSSASRQGTSAGLWHNGAVDKMAPLRRIHTVSFRKAPVKVHQTHLNPNRYVPSNTSVRAVILGGADADASVNGQSKNNGVMLFKFLEDGTLPNGQHSRLRGCRVSGNAYGDISSERAFATLYKISCAHPGEPIIDKEVTGWVFFNGKVGVKGVPLMRDNKIMQWAGISGALSGIASAAQYAQSVQSISSFGAASIVPQSNIGPYAAYGGASKAADVLSQYYVKRAEQYHPVIQVGSGNVVTIVFKDGFYLEPEQDRSSEERYERTRPMRPLRATMNESAIPTSPDVAADFKVPPEVLGQIDAMANQSFASNGVQP